MNVKLKPIKVQSTTIDTVKTRKIRDLSKLTKGDVQLEISAFGELDEIREEVFRYGTAMGMNESLSKFKRNRRYSDLNSNTVSIADANFRLLEDIEDNIKDQSYLLPGKTEADDSNKLFIEGTNGKRISIVGIKSPVRSSHK